MRRLSWNWLTFGIAWTELLSVWAVILIIVAGLHLSQKAWGLDRWEIYSVFVTE